MRTRFVFRYVGVVYVATSAKCELGSHVVLIAANGQRVAAYIQSIANSVRILKYNFNANWVRNLGIQTVLLDITLSFHDYRNYLIYFLLFYILTYFIFFFTMYYINIYLRS